MSNGSRYKWNQAVNLNWDIPSYELDLPILCCEKSHISRSKWIKRFYFLNLKGNRHNGNGVNRLL